MTAPALALRDSIVDQLKESVPLINGANIDSDDIRAQLDVSGAPRGYSSIIVSCVDLGNHHGCVERRLVDLVPKVAVYTHLDEDMAGTELDCLASIVLEQLSGANFAISGWIIHFIGLWTLDAPYVNDAFRVAEIRGKCYIEKE